MSVDDFLSAETRRIIAAGVGAPEPLPRVVPLTTPERARFRPERWAFDWQEAIARAYGIDAAYLADILGGPGHPRYEHARHLANDIYNLECTHCMGRAE